MGSVCSRHAGTRRAEEVPLHPSRTWSMNALQADLWRQERCSDAAVTLFSCRFELFKWLLERILWSLNIDKHVACLSDAPPPPLLSDCTLGVVFHRLININMHWKSTLIIINPRCGWLTACVVLLSSVETDGVLGFIQMLLLFSWFFSAGFHESLCRNIYLTRRFLAAVCMCLVTT